MALKLQHRVLASGLPHRLRLLTFVLALHAHEDGTHIYPSINTLARELGLARDAIIRQLKELRRLGVLVVERPGGGACTTHYRMVPDALAQNGSVSATVPSLPETSGLAQTLPVPVVAALRGSSASATGVVAAALPEKHLKAGKGNGKVRARSARRTFPGRTSSASHALKAQPNGAIRRCLDAYQQSYLQRFGEKPLITGGKDAKLLQQLLATWDETDVLALIATFFTTPDARVQASGYTVGALFAEAQRLRLRAQQPRVDARTLDNMAAAFGATQPRAERIATDILHDRRSTS